MRTITLWCITVVVAHAIPDGGWNGKPWEQEKLNFGVKNFHADALAEWAFCSAETISNIKFDKQKIYRAAKVSAEKGSALGKYMLATCAFQGWGSEIDAKMGLNILQDTLANHPHPESLRLAGIYQVVGDNRFDKNVEEGAAKVQAAAESGSLNAKANLANYLRTGETGEIDLEESAEIYKTLLQKYRRRRVAEYIFRFHAFHSSHFRKMRSFMTEEHYAESEKILREAGRLNHAYSDYLIHYRDVTKGEFHKTLPALIENSRLGPWSHRTVMDFFTSKKEDQRSGITAITMGSYSQRKAAEIAYLTGLHADDTVARAYGSALLLRQETYNPERQAKGRAILRDVFRKNGPSECNASHRLAIALCKHYFAVSREKKLPMTDEVRADYERGMNHLILHAECHHAVSWMVDFLKRDDEITDPAKALAATYLLEKLAWGDRKKQRAERIKNELLKKLTAEQKAQARKLRDEEFPHGDKWREAAFKALQKAGDISEHYHFEPTEKFPEAHGGF